MQLRAGGPGTASLQSCPSWPCGSSQGGAWGWLWQALASPSHTPSGSSEAPAGLAGGLPVIGRRCTVVSSLGLAHLWPACECDRRRRVCARGTSKVHVRPAQQRGPHRCATRGACCEGPPGVWARRQGIAARWRPPKEGAHASASCSQGPGSICGWQPEGPGLGGTRAWLTVLGGSALGSRDATCRLTPSAPTALSRATTSACFHHLQDCPFRDAM